MGLQNVKHKISILTEEQSHHVSKVTISKLLRSFQPPPESCKHAATILWCWEHLPLPICKNIFVQFKHFINVIQVEVASNSQSPCLSTVLDPLALCCFWPGSSPSQVASSVKLCQVSDLVALVGGSSLDPFLPLLSSSVCSLMSNLGLSFNLSISAWTYPLLMNCSLMGDATVKQIDKFIAATLDLTIAAPNLTNTAQSPHQKDTRIRIKVTCTPLTLKLNFWLFTYCHTNLTITVQYLAITTHHCTYQDPGIQGQDQCDIC